ncbi:MAG TPA: pyridoxamine 5'-phosphate oxidase [Acidimicrobiia bacterium]|jgi:pyridoxamine 5'-phosphate oxidase
MTPSYGSEDLPRPIAGPRTDGGRGRLGPFDEGSVDPNPFTQFEDWYSEAQDATDDRAAAMTIATATRAGRPSARVVLLRGFDARGLVFYTNYDSRKGEELDANPHAAALFYWPQLDRQVRVEGSVSRVGRAESEAYFAGRPRGHQVGAWASPQSTPIPDRPFLQSLFDDAEARFADDGTEVPLPPFWGGYRLIPEVFEFWVNRADRLHDRIRYRRDGDPWVIERLAP